jgi:membrane-associated phospholipid phosphatase
MHIITKFGDLAVLLPLATLLAVCLWRWESKEAARGFTLALLVCLSTVLISKLVFLSCGNVFRAYLSSPSGHTATSTFVFGSIGLVMSTHAPRLIGSLALLTSAVLIAAIAVSRVSVGAHSVAEVMVALSIGAAALFTFATKYEKLHHPRINLWLLGAGLAILAGLWYGMELHAEYVIRHWANIIQSGTGICAAF